MTPNVAFNRRGKDSHRGRERSHLTTLKWGESAPLNASGSDGSGGGGGVVASSIQHFHNSHQSDEPPQEEEEEEKANTKKRWGPSFNGI
ncbi:hypothetical protein TcWFU_005505 [Taenia crassiceps]|uniref:Uncharacterized protein n=1 Tax=Taenia crassiceps TaxID=6207 RepID=A0ABR4Q458_9CEST